METSEQTAVPSLMDGTFGASLKRNFKQIREDRAAVIVENAETFMRRKLEDDCQRYRNLKLDRDNMLDLSPENVTTLKLASDFNASEWAQKDLEISITMRNLAISINVGAERYNILFNRTFDFVSYGVPQI